MQILEGFLWVIGMLLIFFVRGRLALGGSGRQVKVKCVEIDMGLELRAIEEIRQTN
jgi:hypothetical protein